MNDALHPYINEQEQFDAINLVMHSRNFIQIPVKKAKCL